MNRVSLAGRLTRDPELRTSPNNVSFVAFTIAVNRISQNANGDREADFINCVVFNKQAENLARYIKKGGLIGVEGKIQTRRYTAQDGSNRTATEVICDLIHFLEPKSSTQTPSFNDYSSYDNTTNNSYQSGGYTPRVNNQPPTNNQEVDDYDDIKSQFDISDDDLPF